MRIAFIVDQFPSLSETFILNQITGLIDRGHEVDIYCDRQGNTNQMHPEIAEYDLLARTHFTVIPRNIVWRYLKGIWLLLINFSRSPDTFLNSLNFFKYNSTRYGDLADWFKPLYLMLPWLKQSPYDIIHCHYGRNGLKAILLKDLGITDGKIIVAFHGNDMSAYLQRHGKNIYDYLFQRADLMQPISHVWATKLRQLGCSPDKIMVHRMGVDCQKFTPTIKEDKPDREILVVSVARLVAKKGLSYGISAIARLIDRQQKSKLRYQIVGDGVLRPELATQIERLQIGDRVELLGWKNRQEVRQIIAQADIVLAPSITSETGDCEGIPVSLMETMAQAIPVVSTYHSGIPELVEDDITGYLAPEKDVPALAQKLEHLAANPSLRQTMGKAGRDKVLKDYNIGLLCDRLVQTYQQLLSQ